MWKTLVRRKEKYSLAEKKELGDLTWRKKYVPIKPKQGFLAAAVREFYSDLADVKHDDNNLSKAF